MSWAQDAGWNISVEFERLIPPHSVAELGKTYMPIGYYRIDCQEIDDDALLEFDTVHFVNVTRKTNIESFPYMIAQLRHGEVVHVYGTGENNARFHNEEGTEVAPLLMLSSGRRRVHVRLPYFGTTDDISGWMTAGAWMVPMKMYNERPFQLLTSNFTIDRRGFASFSWDPRDGPLTVHQRLNVESALCPVWMLPTIATSAFQFTSALGYLDLARIIVPRAPRLWQPRGRAGDYTLVRRLEEALLLGGGEWRQQRIRERSAGAHGFMRALNDEATIQNWRGPAGTVSEGLPSGLTDAEVRLTSMTIASNAEFLASLQEHNRHMEDDHWEG
jgi:hypothetical protein